MAASSRCTEPWRPPIPRATGCLGRSSSLRRRGLSWRREAGRVSLEEVQPEGRTRMSGENSFVATDRRRGSGSADRADTARSLAFRALRRVIEEGAYSNLVLGAELGRSSLSERDRNLASDLVYGTLRRLLLLDPAIGEVSSRPLAAIDAEALTLLRLGAYQLRFTRIPCTLRSPRPWSWRRRSTAVSSTRSSGGWPPARRGSRAARLTRSSRPPDRPHPVGQWRSFAVSFPRTRSNRRQRLWPRRPICRFG